MKKKFEDERLNTMSKDAENWRGPFYVNRKDQRLVVPKFNPMMGVTFNFGNPYAWIALVGLVAIIILINLFL